MRWLAGLAWGLMLVAPAGAQAPSERPATGDTSPIDYARPDAWLCRPGVDDGTCSANLDAAVIDGKGGARPAPFAAAADPKIDCFYVYPTASLDPTLFSDMVPDAGEKRAVHGQAARLRAQCRLFAPIYHSVTMTALRWNMAHPGDVTFGDGVSYRDVRAAWLSYLAHDNRGRGVVLIGHSQGAMLLKRLIVDEIDGKPTQKLLVAAYLAGNPDLSARTFKAIPPCRAADQTGCVIAWSSYLEGAAGDRIFGAVKPGDPPLCVNPAALAGGRGIAKAYLAKPAGDPPFEELVGPISAECVADARGAVLRVRIEPGPAAPMLERAFERVSASPAWGLHSLDVSLVQGNVIDLIGTQSAAWARGHR